MIRVVRQEVAPRYEKNDEPSLTVPDMAPSLHTLLTRFSKGLPLGIGTKNPIYNGDIILPEIEKMDLTELDEYKRNLDANIEKAKSDLKNIQNESKDRKKAAAEAAKQKQSVLPDEPI